MNKYLVLLSFSLLCNISVFGQKWSLDDIKVYEEFEQLQTQFQLPGDSIHVINFWATWCKPCVEELPYFEDLLRDKSLDKLKLTLVSLDFRHQIETKLLSFLNEHSIKANVVVLTDGDSNKYINMVDRNWEGSIPATVIKKGTKKLFFERSFHSTDELKQIINSIN